MQKCYEGHIALWCGAPERKRNETEIVNENISKIRIFANIYVYIYNYYATVSVSVSRRASM